MAFTAPKKHETPQKQASQQAQHNAGDLEQTSKPEVAELAYFKAESRGFIPGYELDDWLEAEQECNIS
jgi:hypothetical protein